MYTDIVLFSSFLLALCLGMLLIPRVVHLSHELHLYDLPDSRKVHKLPIPRLGGVVFLPIVTAVIAIVLVVVLRLDINTDILWESTMIQHFLAYLAGCMMLYSVGLYDDVHSVSYKVKFVVQLISASILCISGLWVADFSYVFFIREIPWWIGMPFTVLAVVYVTNAINLIDGIDGLAAGLCILALAVISGLNMMLGHVSWALMSITMLGVLLSFFYFNVFGKKDKTFMGDAGSLTLGYTLSFLVLHFWQRDPVWNPYFHNVGIVAISTLIIPMFDVVRVMVSRIRDHRDPFLPDKNHIHHKLLRAGLGAKMTMVALIIISASFVLMNYLTASFLSQTLMIVFDVLAFCLMHIIINYFIMRKEVQTGIEWSRIL